MSHVLPTTQAPALAVDIVNSARWDLGEQSPGAFTMIVFYRGYHCPKCKDQLVDLQSKLSTFNDLGVNIVALSMDTKDVAETTYDEWGIKDIPLGYGLDEATARVWGLFLSQKEDGDLFSEPGLFLVKPDGTLYSSSIQTMPFARPHSEDLIGAIQFITHKDYPAGGSIK